LLFKQKAKQFQVFFCSPRFDALQRKKMFKGKNKLDYKKTQKTISFKQRFFFRVGRFERVSPCPVQGHIG
jgi:hypothetical protein